MENTEKSGDMANKSGDSNQEEIIDLTEAIKPVDEEDTIIDLDDVLKADDDDNEEIIDLLDSMTPVEDETESGDSDDILNLTDMVEPVGSDDEILPDLDEPFPAEADSELTAPVQDDADVADSIGLEIGDDDGLDAPVDQIPVSGDQMEAALERVIEKMFGEKIESMIYDVVEKAVSREIRRIKNAIMEDPLD